MTNVYDVPAYSLISEVASDLKKNQDIKMPNWAYFVKTGANRERAPQNEDWWYIRMASILRKVYIKGRVSVKYLRTYYGGKKNRGVKPNRFKKASGKIIRVCLQDLEKIGFVKISDKGGRILTPKGQAYLDKMASKVFKKEFKDKKPFLNKRPKLKVSKKSKKSKKSKESKKSKKTKKKSKKSKKSKDKKKTKKKPKKKKSKKSKDKKKTKKKTKKKKKSKKSKDEKKTKKKPKKKKSKKSKKSKKTKPKKEK